MTAEALIGRARRAAEALMLDVGVITRPAESGTLDGGDWTPDASTEVYNGPLRVSPAEAIDSEQLFGDREVTESRYVATLPSRAAMPQPGDRLTLTWSGDSSLAGLELRVVASTASTWLLYRKVGLEVEL